LTDEIDIEPIEGEETDDEHCKEDEQEGGGAMEEAIRECRVDLKIFALYRTPFPMIAPNWRRFR
jgi:hypothetical protein